MRLSPIDPTRAENTAKDTRRVPAAAGRPRGATPVQGPRRFNANWSNIAFWLMDLIVFFRCGAVNLKRACGHQHHIKRPVQRSQVLVHTAFRP